MKVGPEMVEQRAPNIAEGLRAIHSVVTRGLAVAREQAASHRAEGETGPPEGFSTYVFGLAQVINGHHLTEDELAFPYFTKKIPEMPIGRLQMEHQRMLPLVGRLGTASLTREGAVAGEAGLLSSEALDEIEMAAGELEAIWKPHIRVEESYLTSDRLLSILDSAEDVRLAREFAEHSQRNTHPDDIVVPFLLYNATDEYRWVFADSLPGIVTDELLPKVWRSRWDPMAPFLLAP